MTELAPNWLLLVQLAEAAQGGGIAPESAGGYLVIVLGTLFGLGIWALFSDQRDDDCEQTTRTGGVFHEELECAGLAETSSDADPVGMEPAPPANTEPRHAQKLPAVEGDDRASIRETCPQLPAVSLRPPSECGTTPSLWPGEEVLAKILEPSVLPLIRSLCLRYPDRNAAYALVVERVQEQPIFFRMFDFRRLLWRTFLAARDAKASGSVLDLEWLSRALGIAGTPLRAKTGKWVRRRELWTTEDAATTFEDWSDHFDDFDSAYWEEFFNGRHFRRSADVSAFEL